MIIKKDLAIQERKSTWEVDKCLLCPIIGNCLSISEQRKLLKKMRIAVNELSDYDIHLALGQYIGEKTSFSRRIQRYLDNKYRQKITDIGLCSPDEFLTHWETGLRCGDIQGLLWAGATNPYLPAFISEQMFGDVHMLMHSQGREVRQSLKQVEKLRAEHKKLADKLRMSQKRAGETAQALHTAERDKNSLAQTVSALEAENKILKQSLQDQTLLQENETLRAKLSKLEGYVQKQDTAIAQMNAENEALTNELSIQEEKSQQLQAEMTQILQQIQLIDSQCQTCLNQNLCGRRILLVGGVTKIRAYYQDLVEQMGGEFKHHNGYNNGGDRLLKNLVNWADVVLCPVDVNSHNACSSIKRICKKMCKPYYMLSSSGISNVSRTLTDITDV